MAPTDLSHVSNSFLHALLVHVERRGDPQNTSTPSSTVAGFAAAIAILSAIILGYAAYRGVKWYRARYRRSTTSPNSVQSSQFKQDGPAEINIANSNYGHLAAMSQPKWSHSNLRPNTDTFSQPAGASSNGTHPETRPPMVPPWSKGGHFLGGSDSASDVEAHRVDTNSVKGIPYPSQSYSATARRRGAGGVFGFMQSAANGMSGGRKSEEKEKLRERGTYLMVNESPSIGSPPTQYPTQTAHGRGRDFKAGAGAIGLSHSEGNGNFFRNLGGAASPPLPPLPQTTGTPIDPARRSVEKSNRVEAFHHTEPTKAIPTPINLAPPPPSGASRPPSRMPTTKSFRLTATSSLNGHSVVPSPRVSSLFRASTRLSQHHGYTPASPGLPNPPVIPPIPALPAHLFRLPSMSKSIGSTDDHAKHDSDTSASTSHGDASVGGTEDPTKGPDGKPLPRTMVVTCTFTPTLSDELPLTIGETVSMLEEYIDEWCFVQRVRVMVKEGGDRAMGGVTVSVHGTVDVQNTVTVPVAGEGNLGAVPRFCLSEWPLAIPDSKEEEQTVPLGQGTPTGLPVFTPPAFLPSPPNTSTTPTFSPNKVESFRQPLLPPSTSTRQTQPKPEPQTVRPRPLPTPTPKAPVIQEKYPDSKFSSWGSTETQAPTPIPDVSGLRKNQDVNNTSATLFSTLPGSQPANESPRFVSNSIHPLSSSPSSQVRPVAGSVSSHIHPLADDSRTPSFSSAATSITPPVVPPTSPNSQSPSNSSPAEDYNIKRVSKPPLAPRVSRFPPTPDEDEPSVRLGVHGHSRNPSREGGIPPAAERTVTMPPLPRQQSSTDPSTADSPPPPTQQQQGNPVTQSTAAAVNATTHWGNPFHSRENFQPSATPSTSTDAASTRMGTSAGSHTPSTAATSIDSSPAAKGSFSRRLKAATQVSRSGSLNNIHPPNRPPMGASSSSYGGRVPVGSEKKTGPGKINLKSLRTGSSTVAVSSVGR